MTGADLDRAHLACAMRLTTHRPDAQTWQQWARLLQGRVSLVESYGYMGERPSYAAALCLAADALALLVEVERAENVDPVSGVAA